MSIIQHQADRDAARHTYTHNQNVILPQMENELGRLKPGTKEYENLLKKISRLRYDQKRLKKRIKDAEIAIERERRSSGARR